MSQVALKLEVGCFTGKLSRVVVTLTAVVLLITCNNMIAKLQNSNCATLIVRVNIFLRSFIMYAPDIYKYSSFLRLFYVFFIVFMCYSSSYLSQTKTSVTSERRTANGALLKELLVISSHTSPGPLTDDVIQVLVNRNAQLEGKPLSRSTTRKVPSINKSRHVHEHE